MLETWRLDQQWLLLKTSQRHGLVLSHRLMEPGIMRNNSNNKHFVAFPWVVTSTGPGGFMVCECILWREHSKAHWKCFFLMEKLGIEPATPGLQVICLSPTPRWQTKNKKTFYICMCHTILTWYVTLPNNKSISFSRLFLNSGFWGWLSVKSQPQNPEFGRF